MGGVNSIRIILKPPLLPPAPNPPVFSHLVPNHIQHLPHGFRTLISCLLLASFSQALTRQISQAHWWPRMLAHVLPSPQKLSLSFCPSLTVTSFRLDISPQRSLPRQVDSIPLFSGPSACLISLHTSHYQVICWFVCCLCWRNCKALHVGTLSYLSLCPHYLGVCVYVMPSNHWMKALGNDSSKLYLLVTSGWGSRQGKLGRNKLMVLLLLIISTRPDKTHMFVNICWTFWT